MEHKGQKGMKWAHLVVVSGSTQFWLRQTILKQLKSFLTSRERITLKVKFLNSDLWNTLLFSGIFSSIIAVNFPQRNVKSLPSWSKADS